jgi:prolyl-tRNA editing enzyme YbaK/EbsC (Cys-tRNA(Pro) deacylase)
MPAAAPAAATPDAAAPVAAAATAPAPELTATPSATGHAEAEPRAVIPLPDSSAVVVVDVDVSSLLPYDHSAYPPTAPAAGDSDNERKQHALAAAAGLADFSIFQRVAGTYYDWTLEARRACLGAPSVHYLCKSLVMENTKWPLTGAGPLKTSRFVMVVIQYTGRLHNERLAKAVRQIQEGPRKQYNYRLCSPATNAELTGYEYNGVTPLGCLQDIPIVLSHRIAELKQPFFWLGAGEVDLKWRVSTAEFIRHFKPLVANITYDDMKEDGPEC